MNTKTVFIGKRGIQDNIVYNSNDVVNALLSSCEKVLNVQ